MTTASQPQTQSIHGTGTPSKGRPAYLVDAAREGLVKMKLLPDGDLFAVYSNGGRRVSHVFFRMREILGPQRSLDIVDPTHPVMASFKTPDDCNGLSGHLDRFHSIVLALSISGVPLTRKTLARAIIDSGLGQETGVGE